LIASRKPLKMRTLRRIGKLRRVHPAETPATD
jgi:hypothetical protein